MRRHPFLGIDFVAAKYSDLLGEIEGCLVRSQKTMITTPNPELLYDASRDPVLMGIFRNADYALPDGAGLFVAYQSSSRLSPILSYCSLPWRCMRAVCHDPALSRRYGERMTGSRLTHDLLGFCTAQSIPVIILDREVHGHSEWDERKRRLQPHVAQKISRKFPGITVFHIVADAPDEIVTALRDLDLGYALILGTHGGGEQEKILDHIMRAYPACMTIGIGGSIDLLTGFRSPAPWFFRRFGGEWLYRLIRRPGQHIHRMKKVVSFILSHLSTTAER